MPNKLSVHANFAVAYNDSNRLTFEPNTSCSDDLARVHHLRENYAAIAVGAKTWKSERPRLTARPEFLAREPYRQPLRAVFTKSGSFKLPDGYHKIVCSGGNLRDGLNQLVDCGVTSLMVEGGPTLLRSFCKQETLDAFTLYARASQPEQAISKVYELLPELPRKYRLFPFGAGYLVQFDFGVPVPAIQPHLPVSCSLRSQYGALTMHAFEDPANGANHIALVRGDIASQDGLPPLVRIHSSCQTGEIFGSLHCDCNHQLQSALNQISAEGRGVLIYLDQEGRGIGIRAKALAYSLQQLGLDTFEANEALGLPRDARHFGFAAHILRYLGVTRLRLLTTNPDKTATLVREGLDVVEQVPVVGGSNQVNLRYLYSKVASGHNAALLYSHSESLAF